MWVGGREGGVGVGIGRWEEEWGWVLLECESLGALGDGVGVHRPWLAQGMGTKSRRYEFMKT